MADLLASARARLVRHAFVAALVVGWPALLAAPASAQMLRIADQRISPAACLAALQRTIGQLGPSVVSVAEVERSAHLRITRIETRASALVITCDGVRERLLIERIGWASAG